MRQPVTKKDVAKLARVSHMTVTRALSNSRKSFTLLELLVVVAIIAVLAAMLLPTLQKAREKVKQSLCINALKQWGVAALLYAQDWNGYFPANATGAPGGSWSHYGALGKYTKVVPTGGNLYYVRWGLGCPKEGSSSQSTGYGYLVPRNSIGMPGDQWDPISIHKIKNSSEKWLITDCSSYYLADEYVSVYGAPTGFVQNAGCPWSRHSKGANYLYCDGHVDWIRTFGPNNSKYTNMAQPYE